MRVVALDGGSTACPAGGEAIEIGADTNGDGALEDDEVQQTSYVCVPVSTATTYAIGGAVTGLAAGARVVLEDNGNGGDTFVAGQNGPFAFAAGAISGTPYAVSVLVNPPDESCVVTSGTGTVGTGDVATIAVACTPVACPTTGTGCTAGYDCIGRANPPSLMCAKECSSDADCGPGVCTPPAEGAATAYCFLPCDLATNVGCGTGFVCGFGTDLKTNTSIFACQVPRPDLVGAQCTTTDGCGPGNFCDSESNPGVCRPYCVAGDSSTCPSGTTCSTSSGLLTIAGVEYGLCK